MPTLSIGEPLLTPHLEACMKAIGTVRQTRPNIDLPIVCRFDAPKTSYYVSDIGPDGRFYGVQVVFGGRPKVGYMDPAELQMHKRSGKLYRGDMMAEMPTVAEIARIAHMRAGEAA